MVDYLRNLLLIKLGDSKLIDAPRDQMEQMLKQATQIEQTGLIEAITEFSQAATDSRSSSWQPGLALEMALVKCVSRAEMPAVSKPEVVQQAAPKVIAPPVSVEAKKVNPEPVTPVSKPTPSPVEVKPPAQETPAKVEQPAPASPDLAIIQQNWSKIKDTLRGLNKGTHALVNSARVSGMKNGCLMLGFCFGYFERQDGIK